MKLCIVTIWTNIYEMKVEEFLETHPLFLLWKIPGHPEWIRLPPSKSKISQPPPFANFMKFYGQCPIKGGSIKLSNKHEIAVVHRSVQKKKLALANVFFMHDDQHVLSPGYRLDI